MSQADCGTVNTFYTVTIPATTAEGVHAEDGFYYCDSIAGRWGGQYCPELDIMEANRYAFQTTPHPCNKDDETGNYALCDEYGDHHNTVDLLKNGYGPGKGYTIDTTEPFHVKMSSKSFVGEILSSYDVTLSQGDKSATMTVSVNKYLESMSVPLKHQVFVVSSWAGDDSWLRMSDVPCSGIPANSKHTISNITITTGIDPFPEEEEEEVLVCDPQHPKSCVGGFNQ